LRGVLHLNAEVQLQDVNTVNAVSKDTVSMQKRGRPCLIYTSFSPEVTL